MRKTVSVEIPSDRGRVTRTGDYLLIEDADEQVAKFSVADLEQLQLALSNVRPAA